MQYIIVKVSVDGHYRTEVLDICATRSQAVFKLHNCYCADIGTKKLYIKKDKDDTFVEEYDFHTGYIYNSKTLKYVYRIIEFKPPTEFKKELDLAIAKRKKNKPSK